MMLRNRLLFKAAGRYVRLLAPFSGQKKDAGANKGKITQEEIEEFKQSSLVVSDRPDHRSSQYTSPDEGKREGT